MERAEHYRDLAKRYLRLVALTEDHYLRFAVQYNALAEALSIELDRYRSDVESHIH
jgi:hypothetical protein